MRAVRFFSTDLVVDGLRGCGSWSVCGSAAVAEDSAEAGKLCQWLGRGTLGRGAPRPAVHNPAEHVAWLGNAKDALLKLQDPFDPSRSDPNLVIMVSFAHAARARSPARRRLQLRPFESFDSRCVQRKWQLPPRCFRCKRCFLVAGSV